MITLGIWTLATHHFTPEFGNLSDPSVFIGEEQVMVGNGKSIRISHIGDAVIHSLVRPILLKHSLVRPSNLITTYECHQTLF